MRICFPVQRRSADTLNELFLLVNKGANFSAIAILSSYKKIWNEAIRMYCIAKIFDHSVKIVNRPILISTNYWPILRLRIILNLNRSVNIGSLKWYLKKKIQFWWTFTGNRPQRKGKQFLIFLTLQTLTVPSKCKERVWNTHRY